MTACIFSTQEEAAAALADFESRARGLWQQAGYSVDVAGVIPKRGGVDAPDAQRTQKWDDVREYVEGWGFVSPRTAYPEYADVLLDGHSFVEIEATRNEVISE